jgi:hypothetical protein
VADREHQSRTEDWQTLAVASQSNHLPVGELAQLPHPRRHCSVDLLRLVDGQASQSKQASKQASKASKQASKQLSKQARQRTNIQGRKQGKKQTNK